MKSETQKIQKNAIKNVKLNRSYKKKHLAVNWNVNSQQFKYNTRVINPNTTYNNFNDKKTKPGKEQIYPREFNHNAKMKAFFNTLAVSIATATILKTQLYSDWNLKKKMISP